MSIHTLTPEQKKLLNAYQQFDTMDGQYTMRLTDMISATGLSEEIIRAELPPNLELRGQNVWEAPVIAYSLDEDRIRVISPQDYADLVAETVRQAEALTDEALMSWLSYEVQQGEEYIPGMPMAHWLFTIEYVLKERGM